VPSDELTGKSTLVVVLGRNQARWGFLALLTSAFGIAVLGVVLGVFPLGLLLVLGGVPLAIYATYVLFRHYGDRTLVKANAATIQLHLLSGILLTVGLILSRTIASLA
jgi:1,4-dihydroxy-2-naphthoate octaprenyltransferase